MSLESYLYGNRRPNSLESKFELSMIRFGTPNLLSLTTGFNISQLGVRWPLGILEESPGNPQDFFNTLSALNMITMMHYLLRRSIILTITLANLFNLSKTLKSFRKIGIKNSWKMFWSWRGSPNFFSIPRGPHSKVLNLSGLKSRFQVS